MVAPVGFGTQIKKKRQQRPANMGPPQSLSPQRPANMGPPQSLSPQQPANMGPQQSLAPGQPANMGPPPPQQLLALGQPLAGSNVPNKALTTATEASIKRINQPHNILRSRQASDTNTALGTALRQDINRNVSDVGADPIRQAELLRYNQQAEKARQRQLQELNQAGIIRSGGRVDLMGEFDAGVLQGQADIDARAYQRGLNERRASLGQGLDFSGLTNQQTLDRQALQNSIRQGNISQGFTGATIAQNQARQSGELDLALRQLNQEGSQFGRGLEQELTLQNRQLGFDRTQGQEERQLKRDLQAGEIGQQAAERNLRQRLSEAELTGQLSSQNPNQSPVETLLGRQTQAALDREEFDAFLRSQQIGEQKRQFDVSQRAAAEESAAARDFARQEAATGRGFAGGQADLDRGQLTAERNLRQRLSEAELTGELASAYPGQSNQETLAAKQLAERGAERSFEEQQAALDRIQGQSLLSRQLNSAANLSAADRRFRTEEGAAERQLRESLQSSQLGSAEALQSAQLGSAAALQEGRLTSGSEQAALDRALQERLTGRQLTQQQRQFDTQAGLDREQAYGGTQSMKLGELGDTGRRLQSFINDPSGFDGDLNDVFKMQDELGNLARDRLGRDVSKGELDALMRGESIGGRKTLAQQQLEESRSQASQDRALERSLSTGVFNPGTIGERQTLDAQRLEQQQSQFEAAQTQQQSQFAAAQSQAGQDRALQRSLATGVFDPGTMGERQTLDAQRLEQQQSQFDTATAEGRLDRNQRQRLAEAEATGILESAYPGQEGRQTLAAQQLAQQQSQFDTATSEGKLDRNQRQRLAEAEATGILESAYPGQEGQQTLAAQQLAQQQSQFDAQEQQANLDRNLKQRLAEAEITGTLDSRYPGQGGQQTLAAQQLEQQGTQFDKTFEDSKTQAYQQRQLERALATGNIGGRDTIQQQQIDQQDTQFASDQALRQRLAEAELTGYLPQEGALGTQHASTLSRMQVENQQAQQARENEQMRAAIGLQYLQADVAPTADVAPHVTSLMKNIVTGEPPIQNTNRGQQNITEEQQGTLNNISDLDFSKINSSNLSPAERQKLLRELQGRP